jgi:hypothetical protein
MTETPSRPRGDLVLPLPRMRAPARLRKAAARAATEGAQRLPLAQVSNLLWAAFGQNRHGSGGRAVPRGGMDVYVCLADGTYRYDAREHALLLVSPHDARGFVASHLGEVPALALVFVGNRGAQDESACEECGQLASADSGVVAGNVAAHCAAHGLQVRGVQWFDPQLAGLLGLLPGQRITCVQGVAAQPPLH